MDRRVLPVSRGIAGLTLALIGLWFVTQLSGYDFWSLALTAWLIMAFLGPVLCIGLGWFDTRDDGLRSQRQGDTTGPDSRALRMRPPAPRMPIVEERSRTGWIPLLYFSAVVYLLVSVIVGLEVVTVPGRGPIAACILWMLSPVPLITLLHRHRPDLGRALQRRERSRARLTNRLTQPSPHKSR